MWKLKASVHIYSEALSNVLCQIIAPFLSNFACMNGRYPILHKNTLKNCKRCKKKMLYTILYNVYTFKKKCKKEDIGIDAKFIKQESHVFSLKTSF